MPPKNQVNGFALFMWETRDRERLRLSGAELAHYCNPLWKELSAGQKKLYEARAKEMKAQKKGQEGDMARRDNVGNIIGMRKDPEEERRKRRQRNQEDVVKDWPGKDLTEEHFYFINFQDMCELTEPDNTTEREWLPREFAIVEFSLRRGIMNYYHAFINPGPIPKGFRFTCLQKCEDTHKIPIEDFEHDNTDYKQIWNRIKGVLRPGIKDGMYPPVFCLDNDYEKMKYLMDWLWYRSDDLSLGENPVDRVYAIEDLVVNLLAYSNQPNTERISDKSVVSKLDGSHWDFIANVSCDWHEEQETKHCALGIVRRYAFTISDILSQVYNIQLTDRHVPTRTTNDEVARVLPPEALPSVFNQQRNRAKGRARERPGAGGDANMRRKAPPRKSPQRSKRAEEEEEFAAADARQQPTPRQPRPEVAGGVFFGPRPGQPFGHREVPAGPASGQFDDSDWPELGSSSSDTDGNTSYSSPPFASSYTGDVSSQMSSMSLSGVSSAWLRDCSGRGTTSEYSASSEISETSSASTVRPPPGFSGGAFGPVPDIQPSVGRGVPMQQNPSSRPPVGRGSAPVGRGAPPGAGRDPQQLPGQNPVLPGAQNGHSRPQGAQGYGAQGLAPSAGRGTMPPVGRGGPPPAGRGSVPGVGRGLPVSNGAGRGAPVGDFNRDVNPSVGRGFAPRNLDDEYEPPSFRPAGTQGGGRGVAPAVGRGLPVGAGRGTAPAVGRGMIPGGLPVGRGYPAM